MQVICKAPFSFCGRLSSKVGEWLKFDYFDLGFWSGSGIDNRRAWVGRAEDRFPYLCFNVNRRFEIRILATVGTHEEGEMLCNDWPYAFEMPGM